MTELGLIPSHTDEIRTGLGCVGFSYIDKFSGKRRTMLYQFHPRTQGSLNDYQAGRYAGLILADSEVFDHLCLRVPG